MSGWRDPRPNNADAFYHAFYDDMDAEDDAANALADRLNDFSDFTGNPRPAGEARPLTTAERGPDALPYPHRRRDRPTSTQGAPS